MVLVMVTVAVMVMVYRALEVPKTTIGVQILKWQSLTD